MPFITKTLIAVLFLTLAGCASRGDMESAQRDLNDIKSRMVTMGKDIGAMKEEARGEVTRGLTAFKQEMETIRKETADLQATLESARVDMNALTGKIDDVAISAKKPADDINLLRDDVNRRLTAIEERLLKAEKRLDEVMADQESPEAEKTPEALYQDGLNTFRAGENVKSREIFTKFLGLHPNHELAANAHYWIGETYYNERNYDQAILEFQEVIKNYPGKEKVPASLLKQGMAFKALGDTKSSRYVLKKLVDTYPKTEEAKAAKKELK